MATITATTSNPPRLRSKLFTWTALASVSGDVGSAVDILGYSSLLITSQLASGTAVAVQLQGSHDGTNWFPLVADTTPAGNTAKSTVTAVSVSNLPRYFRPSYSASGGNAVANISVLAR